MKIAALHLLAFGPFTDNRIELDKGSANLHVIYGPNEAGKSSALRAMGELRFGIQLRSIDNFVHPNERLLIGGSFIDAAGARVDLLRSKGRQKTLSYMDPATRQPDTSRPVLAEHERALTGGLGRSDFAAMFGLSHERLREGGKQLLRGDGELGSALFEASAGTRGIAALLGTLDDDARQLFNPRGNARLAVLNDAGKQFEEARRSYRDALIKPADWQQRKRQHDEALAALKLLDEALSTERRNLQRLTELRTVEPLLRQLDASEAELAALAGVPALPDTAREERLAAEPALRRAELDAAEASSLIEECTRELAALQVDDAVVRSASAIERLVKGVESASRSRIEASKLQAAIDRIQDELQAGARRIAGKGALPADVLAAVPSQAEQRAVQANLAALDELAVQSRMLRQQTADSSEQLALAAESRAESMPDASLRAAVLEALNRAQSLGDVEQRLRDLDRQRRELAIQLAQNVSDLEMNVILVESLEGGPTATEVESRRAESQSKDDQPSRLLLYRTARPLLSAEIETVRMSSNLRDELHRKVTHDLEVLQRDIEVQRRRLMELAVGGDVVTQDMLRQTRNRRDEMWSWIRATYIDATPKATAARKRNAQLELDQSTLPTTFEAVQSDADRQADGLRADAQRAAVYDECKTRIEQMLQQQTELARLEMRLGIEERVAMQAWTEQLREAGLPVSLNPTALHEWQVLRAGLLDKADRMDALLGDRELMVASIANAARDLMNALEGIAPDPVSEPGRRVVRGGEPVAVAASIVELARSMRRAVAWEAGAAKQAADHEARTAALAAQKTALAKARAAIGQAESEIARHRQGIGPWLARAFLAEGSTPDICRARLTELQDLQALAAELAGLVQRRQEQVAVGAEVELQAAGVAAQLGEEQPSGQGLQDYADRIAVRLQASQDAARQRLQVTRDLARGQDAHRLASAALERHGRTLARLCQAAGVSDLAALPSVEAAASRKRRAEADVARQRALLARASGRSRDELSRLLAAEDSVALDAGIERCRSMIDEVEGRHALARHAEQQARATLEAVDSSDQAAQWREQMEQAGARYRASVLPWARLKLAHALLQESLKRFRDKAQAPMVQAASRYFATMTGGAYTRLIATEDDDKPVLQAERAGGSRIAIDAMSEGTADQLYLALRLAALELRRASHPSMPLVLDDVLITSDDERSANTLSALAEFSQGTQVLLFTHHRHLIDVARRAVTADRLAIHML